MPGRQNTKTPVEWEVLDDTLLNACRVWDLRARRYRNPESGKEGEFYYIDSRDWVIVIARTPAEELLMIRQFRWGSDELSWEFPGGIIEKGEDPVVAGLRELQEETGYRAARGRLIGRCRPNPAILNNYCHIVYADGLTQVTEGTDWDEHEEIEVQCIPQAQVFEWARQYKLEHTLALTGLLYYQLEVDE